MVERFDCRVAFARTLESLAREDARIVAVVSDSVGSSGLSQFTKLFPQRTVNVGIAEQNMVGIAAGLANGGKIPFVCAASCFLTARALEQIKVDVAYSRANVKLCGMAAGLAYGQLGPTHHSIEDLAWLRAIANLTIIVPADPGETAQAVRAAGAMEGPVFLRVSRTPVPEVHPAGYRFRIGAASVLRPGGDVTLIANGTMVCRALEAAALLAKEGISARVVNLATLHPLDRAVIQDAAESTAGIVTIEEHSIRGGLGGAVAEVVATSCPVPMRILGIPTFAPTGSAEWLFEYFGLTAERYLRRGSRTARGQGAVVSASHVLAIDQGTTNTKALLVDRQGRIVASASRPLSIRYPQPAWVEQDARELWTSVREAVDACLEKARRPALWPPSASATSARAWWCGIAAPASRPGLASSGSAAAPPRSAPNYGAVASRTCCASARAWPSILCSPPARRAGCWNISPSGEKRAANGELAIGTVDSWVLWNLSGGLVHACDLTNASRTQLLDLRSLQWDPALLSLFSIPAAALPAVKPSSHIFGESAGVPSGPGRLAKGIPIGSLVGDSHAALFGHAIFDPGAVKATYGTGSSLMTVTADPVRSAGGLSTTIAWSRAHQTRYALEGNISVTGGAVEWLGEFLGLPHPAEDAARLAASVPDSGGVYLVPAFVGLGAPHWNDAARGLIAGLTRGTRAPQVARATIESIAYQVRDVFEAMERDLSRPLPALLADGGASQNDLLMQFQADILGRPVVRSASPDVSAMGAAWLAGLAAGVWSSLEELAALPRPVERFEPRMNDAERARLYRGWLDAMSRAVKG